jgi:hypothetical protein
MKLRIATPESSAEKNNLIYGKETLSKDWKQNLIFIIVSISLLRIYAKP